MVTSSFFTDGGTYDTDTVTSSDVPGASSPSQAPSSFYPEGNLYDYLGSESEVVALLEQLAATTTTNAAAAATSASNAATSAASAASAVAGAAGTATPIVDGTATVGTSTKWAHEDHVHPTDTSRASVTALGLKADKTYVDTQDALNAPLASPALTGNPTAPTAAAGTNTTQLATTAFVANEAVRYDASQSLSASQKAQARANVSLPNTAQRFTSGSGTYTKPANCVAIRVRMAGGGGGGGGATGSGGGTSGGVGGNTTFGALTANGGSPGLVNGAPGAGGAVSGSPLLGAPGNGGGLECTLGTGAVGGPGGASPFFGGAGSGGSLGGVGGAAGANSGAGGGGGGSSVSALSAGGGGGSGGCVEHFYAAPSATYSYAVGSAGTAGTAGAGTAGAGGAGAAGIIIVEEYY
jgi:hypothetical protein